MARSLTVKFAPISGADLRRELDEAKERRQAVLADPEALRALHALRSKKIDRWDLLAVYDDLLAEGDVA
ncbi:hypothetical protein [Frigidibacter oleivorans]|uniref:hypothetical protein n=1 Tax=Frigidibacter oleivorans TaxID=2487129 RepID=UPI000F8F22F5|nr:hypothetical protein [Frigidibacter oleivorans]